MTARYMIYLPADAPGLTPEDVRQLSRKDNRFQNFNPD